MNMKNRETQIETINTLIVIALILAIAVMMGDIETVRRIVSMR
jgi:hypothetical protein